MDLISANNGILNGGLGNAFSVTLSAPTTIKPVNFDTGTELTIIITQDAAASNFGVTWASGITWNSGTQPNLTSAASGVNSIRLICTNGNTNTYRDAGSGSGTLPAKIASAALGVMMVLTGVNAGMTYHLTAGGGNVNGNEIGKLPAVIDIKAGSGSGFGSGTELTRIDGSGSYKASRFGGIAVGMNAPATDRIDAAANSGVLLPNGNFTTRGTVTVGGATALNNATTIKGALSGSTTFTLSAGGAHVNQVKCYKAGGVEGYMTVTTTGTVLKTCN